MMFSQQSTTLIQKTKINGENAFIANEVVMDSIVETHFKYVSLLSDFKTDSLEHRKLRIKYDETIFKLDHALENNKQHEFEKIKLNELMTIQDKSHENDLDFWKSKAKKKWEYFLYGTAVGAIIIAALVLL